jgi:hypothetical protein
MGSPPLSLGACPNARLPRWSAEEEASIIIKGFQPRLAATAALRLPGAAGIWRRYDFRCHALRPEFFTWSYAVFWRHRQRRSQSDTTVDHADLVDWVPSDLGPSGPCLGLGPWVSGRRFTPMRSVPHRGGASADQRVHPGFPSVKDRAPGGVYAGRVIFRVMAPIKATNARAIAATT